MADTQEFLETPEQQMIQVCTDIYYECKTIKKLDELTDKALAILQHFQQEQERAVLIARVDELGKLPASPQVYKREAGFRLRALEKELSKHKEQCWCGSKENPHIHSGECPSNTTGL